MTTEAPESPGPTPHPMPVVPLAYARPGTIPLLPVRERARNTIITQWLMIGGYAVSWAASLATTLVAPADPSQFGSTATPNLVVPVISPVVGLGFIAIAILSTVYYCMWQYRVHSNAGVFDEVRMRWYTPGWGVAYWFIPIVNLFRPFQVVHAIDGATPADARLIRPLINVWWIAAIASFLWVVATTVVVEINDFEFAPPAALAVETLTTVLDVSIILMTIRIVRSITERQAATVGA